jgi:hypothetical protein
MYALYDTFNKNIVSRHRTIAAAVKANRKLQDSLTGGSYLPTTVKRLECGGLIELNDYEREEMDCEQMSGNTF